MVREFRKETPSDGPTTSLALEAGVVGVVLAGIVATVFVGEGVLRVIASLVGAFVVPGYALTTILFPEHGGSVEGQVSSWADSTTARNQSLSHAERAVVSLGASIVIVVLSMLVFGRVGLGYSQSLVTTGLTAFSVAILIGGLLRRVTVAHERRFTLPVVESVRSLSSVGGDSSREAAVNVALALGIVAATGGLVYGIAAPQASPSYTEATLKTEVGDGEFAAVNPETTVEQGGEVELLLEVTNRLGTTADYTVVVELHRIGAENKVLLSRPVNTYQSTLEDGETWRHPHTLEMTMTGSDLRVTYLIYRGEPPENPTVANSHRYLTYWVSVSP